MRRALEPGQRARVTLPTQARTYFEASLPARPERPIRRRPVGFVNMMFALPDTCTVTELADVVMINRYYGWYVEPGDLAGGGARTRGRAPGLGRHARQAHHRDRVRS